MWRFLERNDVPQFLNSLDLPGVAEYIKSNSCKNIIVMAGAGISTSAGIPDFRSPDTGLYANLSRLNLPYPEAVFDISFFRQNPRPFYVLAHELAPGKFRPTLTHSFIKLLAKKGLLHTCFTQNIDTLERVAGVPGEKIVEAHGSFADQHCINCGAPYPHEKIKQKIQDQEIPICERRGCGGFVKPDIVFFGESLPDSFFRGIRQLSDADLLIVMGTSLTVHPFASLAELVPEECPRLLINLDYVGSWGSRANDVACLMPCDHAVRALCRLLGWEEELDALWSETALSPKKLATVSEEEGIATKLPKERKVSEEEETPQGKQAEEEKVTPQEKAVPEEAEISKEAAREEEAPEEKKAPEKEVAEEEAPKEKTLEEKGALEEKKTPEEKEVETKIEKTRGKEEEKEKETEKVAEKEEPIETNRAREGKHVNEELLANVVDKLAETISEVRLEDERKSEDATEQKGGRNLPGIPSSEAVKTGEESDEPDKAKEGSLGESLDEKDSEESPQPEEKSSEDSSTQAGKV